MDPAVNEQYYLLVAAKLRETAAHVIAMSVLVLNLRKIQRALLRMLAYLLEILAQNKNWALVQWTLVILYFAFLQAPSARRKGLATLPLRLVNRAA